MCIRDRLSADAIAEATAGGSLSTQILLDAHALATALATGALTAGSVWTPSAQRTLTLYGDSRILPAVGVNRRLELPL